MKRIAASVFFTALITISVITVYSENSESAADDLYDISGSDELWRSMPKQTRDLLEDMGIGTVSYEKTGNVDIFTFLKAVSPSVRRNIANPLKTGAKFIVILMICLIASSLSGENSAIRKISAAVCGIAFLAGAADLSARAAAVESASCAFMQAYIPVFASLKAAGGSVQTASGYSVFLLGACAAVETACDKVLVPAAGMLFSMGAVTGITQSPASAVSDLINKAVKWGLGIIGAVSGALFSLQTGIAAASDSTALRTAKFAVSGFVPIVGNTLSEALGTVTSAAKLMSGSTGAIGIFAVLTMTVPTVSELLIWSVMCRLAAFFCESTDFSAAGNMFMHFKGVIDILTAVLSLTAALFIFATAILVRA